MPFVVEKEIIMLNIQSNRILPNLFDKLTDDDPGRIMEPLQDREASIEKYKNIVMRDLISLLNSSVTIEESDLEIPKSIGHVIQHDLSASRDNMSDIGEDEKRRYQNLGYAKKSTLTYGMKSFAGMTFSDSNKQTIIEEIKRAILKFERRIYKESLEVELMKDTEGQVECTANHKVKISITGVLRPLQKKERIFIKTEIDLETGRFELVA